MLNGDWRSRLRHRSLYFLFLFRSCCATEVKIDYCGIVYRSGEDEKMCVCVCARAKLCSLLLYLSKNNINNNNKNKQTTLRNSLYLSPHYDILVKGATNIPFSSTKLSSLLPAAIFTVLSDGEPSGSHTHTHTQTH